MATENISNPFRILSTVCTECNLVHFDNPKDISCNEICSNLSLHNLSTIVTEDTEQTQFSCNIIREEARPPIQINSEIPFKHRGIHVVNLNIRHVKPKLDELKIMFENNKCIDVFGICETFLNETVDDKLLTMNGYRFERKDRRECNPVSLNKGGGILIYISNNLNYSRRNDLESHEIESVWLEIELKNSKPFLICSFYRPPSSPIEWYEKFSMQIEKSLSLTDEIYLMGDINVDLKNGILTNTAWKHIVELHDLQQLIEEHTRVTAHSETLIDHLYVSTSDKVTDISVPSIAISDHYPICFTRSTSKINFKRQSHKSIQYRCYKKFNEERFLTDLFESLNSVNLSNSDSDHNFKTWTTSFISVFDKHAPFKTKRVKHETQPDWINGYIKSAMKNRDTNHKLKNWYQYKYWRNKTISLINSSKKHFFARSIDENRDNTFLWKHINSLNGKTSEQRIPHELIIDNKTYNEISDIIEKLNHYFSTISAKLQIDHAQENLPFDLSKLTNYVDSKVPSNVKFQIPLMKLPDLISIIGSLDASKATGLDGITAKILKSSSEIICPSLLKIINISISTGIFPECLKQAKVIPVHKSGPYNDPANYRPISILPILSKIIEKHVTKHLFAYLNKYGLLHKSQSGFRKNHSCNTALINLVDKWLNNIDKGEIIGAIFFDLRKAFDVVDHQLLIEKVNSYHFSNNSVNWIRSYLTDRQQCITEKNNQILFSKSAKWCPTRLSFWSCSFSSVCKRYAIVY